MKRTTKLAILSAALTLGVAAAASAQPYGYGGGPGWGPGAGMGMGMGMGPGMMGGRGMMMGGGRGMMRGGYAVEEHLAAQKVALNITPAQETAWQEYAAAAKKQSEAMLAHREAMLKAPPANAAEHSDLRLKFMKEHVAQAEGANAAFKNLYAALTPEQKATLEQRGFGPGAGRHGRWR